MKKRILSLLWRSAAWTLILLLATPTVALAASIVLDGLFDDWAGQPNISDPIGDATPARVDISAVYWANNPGVSNTYFMIQRAFPGGQGNQVVYYSVFIDTNCNGSYSESTDRRIFVAYSPQNNIGVVVVAVLSGTGSLISTTGGNWGDPRGSEPNGGTRAEFYASFSDLGISPNQQICFYVASFQNAGDSTPVDTTASITWTPIPAMGYALLAAFVLLAVGIAWSRKAFAGWKKP
ncbi:MAG: hypothetical protein AB1531_02135 [Chloroflexota bacterium]